MIHGYDSIADLFDAIKADKSRIDSQFGYNPARQLIEGIQHPLNILDFGCGGGHFNTSLIEAGHQVIGVDPSHELIERARKRNPQATYLHYDGLLGELLAGERFDVAFANLVYTVIADTELRYILRDKRQLLKPGGKLYILEPNLPRCLGIDYGQIAYNTKSNPQNGDIIDVYLRHNGVELPLQDIYRNHDHYRNLLSKAGFVDIQITEPTTPSPEKQGKMYELARQYPPFFLITAR